MELDVSLLKPWEESRVDAYRRNKACYHLLGLMEEKILGREVLVEVVLTVMF
jgi:hypothetical protein